MLPQVNTENSLGQIAVTYFVGCESRLEEIRLLLIVEYLVSKGAKLDHIDGDGHTFMFHAVYWRNLLLVQYALRNGFGVNQPVSETHSTHTRNGFTLFWYRKVFG